MGGAGTAVKLASHFHMAQHLVEAGEDGLDHASLCREAQASDVGRVDMKLTWLICLQGLSQRHFETLDGSAWLWMGMELHSKVLAMVHVVVIYVMYPRISC